LAQVQRFIQIFNGKIYFTRHSYGVTVSPILALICMNFFPDKDISSMVFGPILMMNDKTRLKYRDKMITIAHDHDLVPSLSVPNLYERFTFCILLIKNLPEDELIKIVKTLLMLMKPFMFGYLYEALKEDITSISDTVLAYS
jgi:hypothetical protein